MEHSHWALWTNVVRGGHRYWFLETFVHPFLAGAIALNCFLMRVLCTESRTNGPDLRKQAMSRAVWVFA